MRIHPIALAKTVGLLCLLAPMHAVAAGEGRNYGAGSTYLEIDLGENRKVSGFVKDLDGGNGTAEVIREATEGAVRKRLGAISYEPFVVQIDPCGFQPWIRQILANGHFSGRIYRIDSQGNVAGMQAFGDSWGTDLQFPAFDGASKDISILTVTFHTESVTTIPQAEAGRPAGMDRAASRAETPARANNFRIEIPSVDTKMVRGVAAFTAHIEDGVLDVPDLKVTVGLGGAQSWRDWHDRFVIHAQNDVESSLRFTYLKPDLTTELCSYQLGGVGIVALRRATSKAGDPLAAEAQLYVETLQMPAGAHP